VSLIAGFQKIKFEKEGYETIEKEIHVKGNEKISVKLNEKMYSLKINANISEAKVYIDGNLKGKAPYTIKLSKGKHKIKLTKDDFGDKEKEFEINKDETISFELYEKGNKKEEVKTTTTITESGMVKILGKKFKMDVTEVTVAQFKKCVNAGKCEKQHYNDGKCYVWNGSEWKKGNVTSEFKEDKKPAVCVDWEQAKSYCKWAGKRLPTEDEWEYAAKGGESYKYSGSNNADEVAWYDENSGDTTHEVATKKANGYGLYDISGNVWEWAGTSGVIFGGGFNNSDNNIRVDSRYDNYVDYISYNIGFRCVQSL